MSPTQTLNAVIRAHNYVPTDMCEPLESRIKAQATTGCYDYAYNWRRYRVAAICTARRCVTKNVAVLPNKRVAHAALYRSVHALIRVARLAAACHFDPIYT